MGSFPFDGYGTTKGKIMSANKRRETKKEMEQRFEAGQDLPGEFDTNTGTRTVNVELPVWAIKALDQESARRGITRRALINMWIVDNLDALKKESA